ncbi:hypothetical protein DAPPUDRAFT_254351 [Daphnia pulex]|uniref:Uncharacterized protein n=1 Tax=Daphnia pulex TaxID=6669 RepID=E9H6Z1_DAPPU|nr:hypothetical protein DAPPUDRAFT_254351 [Daphnia pulex]|eukprot:EFX72530.1 hypothetical protein DAPPUDRAFT_254351 [Daphnia pulex]
MVSEVKSIGHSNYSAWRVNCIHRHPFRLMVIFEVGTLEKAIYVATKKNKDDEDVQVGVLLTLLGQEGLRIYETFTWTTAGDENKIAPVLVKFDGHFQPRKSQTFERYKFLTRHQREVPHHNV